MAATSTSEVLTARSGRVDLLSPHLLEPRRRQLYVLIDEHPGVHLRELSRATGMDLGVLRWHLGVLRRAELVRTRRSGRRRLYFTRYYVGSAGSSRGERILAEVVRSEGVSPQEIAERQGVSRMLVHYHLKRLQRSGRLRSARDGQRLRVYLEGATSELGVRPANLPRASAVGPVVRIPRSRSLPGSAAPGPDRSRRAVRR